MASLSVTSCLDQFLQKLDALESLEFGWDSYSAPPPSKAALAGAKAFLHVLEAAQLSPTRLAPAVVGGVGITFRGARREVYVEFSNSGSVHVVWTNGDQDPKVSKLDVSNQSFSAFLRDLRAYLYEST